jgi:hypothetical protein
MREHSPKSFRFWVLLLPGIAISLPHVGVMSEQLTAAGTSVSSATNELPPEQEKGFRRIPEFADFPSSDVFIGQPAPIDVSSHPVARMYATKIREGAAAGPNFTGRHAIVTWRCGNECQQSLIVNVRTGKVYGVVEPPSKPPAGQTELVTKGVLKTSRGANFRLGSRLLVADPPCSQDYNPCVSWGNSERPVRYYVMDENGLKLIHTVPCRLVNNRQVCGS